MPVAITQTGFWPPPPPPPVPAQQPTPLPRARSPNKRLAAVASQPNPSAYPSQLRANNPGRHRTAKYSDSSRLQHSPPSKTAILALHRYTNDRPSKCHCHRAPANGSQRLSTDFSRNSGGRLQRRTKSQPQYLHIQN